MQKGDRKEERYLTINSRFLTVALLSYDAIILFVTMTNEKEIQFGSQQYIDYLTLMYHREIAERLRTDPESVLNRARNNLKRWMSAHEGTSSERALKEWQELIDTLSVPELIAVITEDSDNGQRIRSSTPFMGILSETEIKELRQRCEEEVFA
jgi:hypothetical protein